MLQDNDFWEGLLAHTLSPQQFIFQAWFYAYQIVLQWASSNRKSQKRYLVTVAWMNHRAKGEEIYSAGLRGDCRTVEEPVYHTLVAKLWEPRQLGQFFHIRWVVTVLQYDWANRYEKIKTGTPPHPHIMALKHSLFHFFLSLLRSFRYSYARESTAKNTTFWKRHLNK